MECLCSRFIIILVTARAVKGTWISPKCTQNISTEPKKKNIGLSLLTPKNQSGEMSLNLYCYGFYIPGKLAIHLHSSVGLVLMVELGDLGGRVS